MSHQQFSIRIDDVVDLLGLERDPKGRGGADSYNVKCPFCASARTRKYHMNINVQKNVYFCPKCMDASTGGSGALDLYGRVRHGTPLIPGRNGKELYHKLACELEGTSCRPLNKVVSAPEIMDVFPAGNEDLNKAYSALLSLPYLALNLKHGKNLMKRGLDREAIESGHYASFLPASKLLPKMERAQEAIKWYNRNRCEKYRSENPILKYYSAEEILVGILIAKDLTNQGVELDRVPGFFKFRGVWCLRYDQGMAIPTVALDGNIVGIQVRRDVTTEKGLRYMTLSSKGLDAGVTTQIARTHVARNAPITKDTGVYVTEGPLKANVIMHLLGKHLGKDIAVIAIQGVNNTKELPALAKELSGLGVKEISSAFDMDKTGNLAVARGASNVRKIFKAEGLAVSTLCWDAPYAKEKCAELISVCEKNGLTVPESTGNVFKDIHALAVLLSGKNIEFNVKRVNGKVYKDNWRDETKGLDDYLNYLENQKSA